MRARDVHGEVLVGPDAAGGGAPRRSCGFWRRAWRRPRRSCWCVGRTGISSGQLYTWRRQFRTGELTGFAPVVVAIAERYSRADRTERGRILDEFTAVTGFHRKHAMRLLRDGQPNRRSGPRPRRRIYDEATREALIVIWEAS